MPSCVTIGRTLGTLAGMALALATASCTSILGDFDSGKGDASAMDGTTGGGGDGSMTNGDAAPGLGNKCATTAQCNAGQTCADGVCCESACDGVCESCNQAGAAGHCNPVPAMTDPDKECVMIPMPEAGAPDAGPTGDANTDGGEAGIADAASEAAITGDGGDTEGGAAAFNLPDSGVTQTAGVCAGSCNGARACVYPDQRSLCGTQFCNTSTQAGGFACDSTGRCGPALTDCKNFACESITDGGTSQGACATNCTREADCNPDVAFCDGQTCQPKHGDGIMCTTPNQCESGFCVTNGPASVCCNQACDPTVVTGGTCSASGSVGQCTCPHCTGAGNSCVLWYKDGDNDTFGDNKGTIALGTAQVGCSNSAPPAGWVTNNSDCDDSDLNVYPGQTAFFSYPSRGGTFDYNCDGTKEKQTPETLGAGCGLCENNPSCGTNACGSSTAQMALSCHTALYCGVIRGFETVSSVQVDLAPVSQPIGTIAPPIGTVIGPPIGIQEACCNSVTVGITQFSASITGPNGSCGVIGTRTTCGACGGTATTTTSVYQACH